MTTIQGAREIADVQGLVANVHGWLTPGEGELLYTLARRARAGHGVIVEIGSWKGKSTIFLGSGSLAGPQTPVFAIDPHTGSPEQRANYGAVGTFEEFTRNITRAGVDRIVRPLVARSSHVARTFAEPIELLFIDGAHDYDSVREDFDDWSSKVVDGGCIAFHDSRKPGPRQVIRESVSSSPSFTDLHSVDSITVVRKVARNSAFDRLRNRLAFRTYLLTKRSV